MWLSFLVTITKSTWLEVEKTMTFFIYVSFWVRAPTSNFASQLEFIVDHARK